MKQMLEMPRRAALVTCLVALSCAACALCGCVFSDTITEIVYEQDKSLEIDYDAPKRFINSTEGTLKSDRLPRLRPVEQGDNDIMDLPDFEGDISQVETDVITQAGDAGADTEQEGNGEDTQREPDAGSEQNDEMNASPLIEEGPEDTGERFMGESEKQASKDNPADSGIESDTKDNTDKNNAATDDPGSTKTNEGQEQPADDAGGTDKSPTDAGSTTEDPNEQSKVGENAGSAFYDAGEYDDLPSNVKTVAAVGNAAIAAASLGGADGDQNLIAADADLLGGQAASVMASKGITRAVACWDGDGVAAGTAHVDALVALNPKLDAVLVTEGTTSLTADEQALLLENNIQTIFVPAMNTPEKTRNCVLRIGALLGKGGDKAAADAAVAYRDFYDAIVAESASATPMYTLYVTQWRPGTYIGPFKTSVNVTGGAFAPGGALTVCMNEYLNLAGVRNMPSDKPNYKSLDTLAIVWPLKGGTSDEEWSDMPGVNGGLLSTDTSYSVSLTYRKLNDDTYRLGDSSYPAIICNSVTLRDTVTLDRAQEHGLYSANNENTSISSNSYGVLVNPYGLFSSWTDGSMESILETAWAHEHFHGVGGYLDGKLKAFYKTFYGYDLTDTAPILNATNAK